MSRNPADTGNGLVLRSPDGDTQLPGQAPYAPDTMAVLDVDLGHTDPQVVIPYGGSIRVDGPARRIVVTY